MRKRILALLLALAVMVSLAACGGSDAGSANGASTTENTGEGAANDGDDGESNAASGEEIKIGLYGTITGSNALAGEMMEKGAQLAVDLINADGGIDGRPLRLVVYDDKSTPEGAVTAVTRLVDQDKVVAMVGSNSSPNILATTQITEEAGIIQVGGGTSPSYTNAGFDYLFRGTANGDLPNETCVNAMKQMGIETVGILSVASEYGTSGVDSFKSFLGSDIEVVAEEVYQSTDTDYTGQISKILSANPDAIIVYGMTNESALAIRQLRRNGFEDGYIFGGEALGVPDLIQVAEDSANNVIFGSGAIIPATVEDAANDVERAMLEAFVATYGSLPVSDVAYRGYDSVMLIAEALRNAEDIDDSNSIREAFLNITDYPGIAGNYDFSDGSGDGLTEARAYIIQDQKHVLFSEWYAENF